jgi:glycosyltransferase involved in cell wall biosynthesis
MIFASSPDRGLVYLLKNWDQIKKAVPKAELEIYYGFNVYDAIHGRNPARMAWKAKILEMMKQDGISYKDRVGHQELADAFAGAGIWTYPTDFTEISCISAMKAQAYGAVPVVTNYAALKETVKNGIKVDVDIRTKAGQEEYVAALVSLLKDPAKQEDIRKTMMPFAQDYYLWNKVAQNWNQLFKGGVVNGHNEITKR